MYTEIIHMPEIILTRKTKIYFRKWSMSQLSNTEDQNLILKNKLDRSLPYLLKAR